MFRTSRSKQVGLLEGASKDGGRHRRYSVPRFAFDQVVRWSSRPGGLRALQREVHPRLHAMVIEATDFPLRMD